MVDVSRIATVPVQAQTRVTVTPATHQQMNYASPSIIAAQTMVDVASIQYADLQDLAIIIAHATPDIYLIRYQALIACLVSFYIL